MTYRICLLLFVLLSQVPIATAEEPPDLLVKHISVLDVASGKMVPNQTVWVSAGRIKSVTAADQLLEGAENLTTIDGSGKFMIPGLIDAHVHLVHLVDRTHVTGDEFLPLFVAAGVTSVRSAGDAIVAEAGVANFAASHPDYCPRVFLASPLIDGASPFHKDVGYALPDPANVKAFVEDMAKWKVTTLKIYVGTPRAVGQEVIKHGHLHGMRVTGHLGNYSAQDAAADGIDCFEHIWSVFNYSIPDEVKNQPDHRANLDLRNPKCQALIKLLANEKVAVDATLVVFKNMIYLNDLDEVQQHPDMALVPKRMKEHWENYRVKSALPLATRPARQREILKYQELTGMLHQAGVTILVGTDTPEPFVTPGFSMHQELELLVESGLSPADAIRAATLENATMLNQREQLGSIEAGKLADLVILTADPTEDIRNTRKIESVLRGGHLVQPEKILQKVPVE
jgi:imidazolonepropionase-like amidohydrolase